ncbi:MAG: hypothetical protein ACXWT1_20830 [Methylobacter sp.]
MKNHLPLLLRWFPSSGSRRYTQVQLSSKSTVIPAGKPESSHRNVKLWVYTSAHSSTCATATLPSMALDSGFPAGMTRLNTLVYNDESSGLEIQILEASASRILRSWSLRSCVNIMIINIFFLT